MQSRSLPAAQVRLTSFDGGSACSATSHPIVGGAAAAAGNASKPGATPNAPQALSREPSMSTTGCTGGSGGSLSLPDMLEATLWNRRVARHTHLAGGRRFESGRL